MCFLFSASIVFVLCTCALANLTLNGQILLYLVMSPLLFGEQDFLPDFPEASYTQTDPQFALYKPRCLNLF